MLKTFFEDSKITELDLTEEIKYLEFDNFLEYKKAIHTMFKLQFNILRFGRHRLKEKRWIIVFNYDDE